MPVESPLLLPPPVARSVLYEAHAAVRNRLSLLETVFGDGCDRFLFRVVCRRTAVVVNLDACGPALSCCVWRNTLQLAPD